MWNNAVRFTLLFIFTGFVLSGCAKDKAASTTADATKPEGTVQVDTAKTTATTETAKAAEAAKPTGPVTMDGITVHSAVACRAVQDRTPVESGSSFPSDVGRIYLFSKVGVESGGEKSIKHVWYFKDQEVATVTLPVRGASWRTYSSKAIQNSQTGAWRVDVSSGDGVVVNSVSFNIIE